MKKLLALIAIPIPMFAASWDGTKGSIALSTDGDAQHTVLKLSSLAPEALVFRVVATLTDGRIKTVLVYRQSLRAIAYSATGAPPFVLAILDVPQSAISSVGVSLHVDSEDQIF
jgi:hypothetical protein